jgi:iron-sulfur cluster assembly protein
MAVRLTATALSRIKTLMTKAPQGQGVKFSVKSGGCSGFEYIVGYGNVEKFDEVVNTEYGKVIIDSIALMYMKGTEIDHISDMMQNRFVFNNPNAEIKCGCGKSFS